MYTRGGDKGETGLYGSKRVAKDSPRVEACGTVDELNSCIGVSLAGSQRREISEELKWVQRKLFVVGADLTSDYQAEEKPGRQPRIVEGDTKKLEAMIDSYHAKLPHLANFILPGGSALSANLHLARSVCRRAERAVVSLAKKETVNPELLPFLNRLSTYLFNAARFSNYIEGIRDEVWEND
jgi:cob(I)alamin adenosyltransferase